jgi:geranylgeranyl pyrophosphate synthase
MNPELARYMQSKKMHIRDKLKSLLGETKSNTYPQVNPHLYIYQEAALYSVGSEGKRIRPIFVYAAADAVGCADWVCHGAGHRRPWLAGRRGSESRCG